MFGALFSLLFMGLGLFVSLAVWSVRLLLLSVTLTVRMVVAVSRSFR